MAIAKKERNITISIDDKHLKQANEFTYLGSIISSEGKNSKEIQNRCNKTYQILGQMTRNFKNKIVNIDTNVALYKIIIIPSLCYQCQTWTMTAQDKRKIVTGEITCLRRILGVSLRDRIRNDNIRQITSIGSHQKTTDQVVFTCFQTTNIQHATDGHDK